MITTQNPVCFQTTTQFMSCLVLLYLSVSEKMDMGRNIRSWWQMDWCLSLHLGNLRYSKGSQHL